MSNEISTQKDVLKKITTEHLLYTNRISSYTKPELFENALWIHSIGMVYDHILEYRLEPDDLRLLASLQKPLNSVAREYMKAYEFDDFAMSIEDGITAAGNRIKSSNPKLFANLRYVNVGDADRARLMKHMDDEFLIYRDVILTLLNKEEIIARAEPIALWQAVHKAMQKYPYHEDEIRILLQLERPLIAVEKYIEKTASDDTIKWDLMEMSFENVRGMNEAPKKKKSHNRDTR
jgi:hypothetical protein